MSFSEVADRLERFVKGLHAAVVTTTIFEGLLVILIGVSTTFLIDPENKVSLDWLGVLVIVAVLYLMLFGFRTWYMVNYPAAIVNELRAERELTDLKKDASRQKSVGELIVKVIANLNDQTCLIVNRTNEGLCDKDLQDGLSGLLVPILSNTSFLLDTNDPHATVGVYLEEYASVDPRKPDDDGILILKDDLRLAADLPKDLFKLTNSTDLELWIHGVLRESFNNYEYVARSIIAGADGPLTLYCSPMPVACDEGTPLGVLFIIARGEKEEVEGLASSLSIFNRLISNWVFRYNACVREKMAGTTVSTLSDGMLTYPTEEERLAKEVVRAGEYGAH